MKSDGRKVNPYSLIWYKQGWSKTKIERNNTKYYEWEFENNGFRLFNGNKKAQ